MLVWFVKLVASYARLNELGYQVHGGGIVYILYVSDDIDRERRFRHHSTPP
jgi:hypothetical protein